MTTIPQTAPGPTDDEGDTTGATGVVEYRLVETAGASSPKTMVSLLFGGGLALTGLLSGTGITAPSAESPVWYLGGWTGTARTVAAIGTDAVQLPARRTEPIAARAEAAAPEHSPDIAGVTGVDWATQADEVRWLHEASGLTWEQLGRVFGVSRRAVHLWANDGRMNATNAELLGQLVALVRELPGRSSDDRRTALLAPTSDGSSLVDQLRARHRSDTRDVSGTPFRPEELVGARHDETGHGAGSGTART